MRGGPRPKMSLSRGLNWNAGQNKQRVNVITLLLRGTKGETTPNVVFWSALLTFCRFHWPVDGVELQTPWSLWRHRRFSSSSSCRCKHSPLQSGWTPLWSPRSEGECHKVKKKKKKKSEMKQEWKASQWRSGADVSNPERTQLTVELLWIVPLCNAAPLWRWSAVSACRSSPDACFRLWPNSSDTDTGFHCPPLQIAAHIRGTQHGK